MKMTFNQMVTRLAKQLEANALESFGVSGSEVSNHAPSQQAIALAEKMLTERFEFLTAVDAHVNRAYNNAELAVALHQHFSGTQLDQAFDHAGLDIDTDYGMEQ
jgi:hypothetical protein